MPGLETPSSAPPGQWLELSVDDRERLTRFCQIMERMDRAYDGLESSVLRSWIHREGLKICYYTDPRCEVVMMILYELKRRRWRVMTMGFSGAVEPSEALDRAVEGLADFMHRHQVQTVYGIRRKVLDDPGICQFYDLVPHHPRLRVSVLHDTPEATAWEVSLR